VVISSGLGILANATVYQNVSQCLTIFNLHGAAELVHNAIPLATLLGGLLAYYGRVTAKSTVYTDGWLKWLPGPNKPLPGDPTQKLR